MQGDFTMEFYNYLEVEKQDIISYFKNEFSAKQQNDILKADQEHFNDILTKKLFSEDSVTGNGSGSYTMDPIQAELNLVGNWELLQEATNEIDPEFDIIKSGAEAGDVLVRVYLLPEAIEYAYHHLTNK